MTGNTVSFQHRGSCTITATTGARQHRLPARHRPAELRRRQGRRRPITFTSIPPTDPSVDNDLRRQRDQQLRRHRGLRVPRPPACAGCPASTVTFDHAGRCEIDADQAGTDDYQAAPTVSQVVSVRKEPQSVTFTSTAPTAPALGSSYAVSATSTSGGPVTFSIDPATTRNACTLDDSGSSVTFQHAGRCVVDADQPGTDDYQAAPTASQEIVVPQSVQSISFTSQATEGATGGLDVRRRARPAPPVARWPSAPAARPRARSTGSTVSVRPRRHVCRRGRPAGQRRLPAGSDGQPDHRRRRSRRRRSPSPRRRRPRRTSARRTP